MILNFLFTALMPLLMIQGIILEQEVYGDLLTVPQAEECLEQYDLNIELHKEKAIINNKLQLKVSENRDYIEIYIPHIAFNNGMKKGAFSNDGSALYRSNDFKQFKVLLNGRPLSANYEYLVHDSLKELRYKFKKLDSIKSLDYSRERTDLLEGFNQFELAEEFDNKVISGKYPWYILKIKNNSSVSNSTIEINYQLELGPLARDRSKNYLHFKFNTLNRKLETPVQISIDIKKLPLRKIKSQLPEELVYDKVNKLIMGTIDSTSSEKLLLRF